MNKTEEIPDLHCFKALRNEQHKRESYGCIKGKHGQKLSKIHIRLDLSPARLVQN